PPDSAIGSRRVLEDFDISLGIRYRKPIPPPLRLETHDRGGRLDRQIRLLANFAGKISLIFMKFMDIIVN
ncbi:MAG TPA: hypothetical protein PLA50_08370, partial [Bacteroidia bacterium]|nr:hypothetical protein [Bacteroidia bacterium]